MSIAPTSRAPQEIFKAYDIRGIVEKALTPDVVEAIGQAIGSEGKARGVTEIAIGRDGRLSGPGLAAALARGIQSAGVNVVDVGRVATPMLYFAAYHLDTRSGVMVTGSHNPPEYNGLKILLAGETLAAGAPPAHRGRLRQRRRRRHRAGAVPRPRLRGDRALLRGRRQLPPPPSRPQQAREPA